MERDDDGADAAVDDPVEAPERSDPPRPLLIACGVLGLQVAGLLVAAGVLVDKTLTGDPNSVGRALWGAGFALVGAAVLALCARGLLRARPAARTPVVVLELLLVPVSYSLAFQAGRVGYGGPIFVSALAVLYLLFTPPVRAVLDRDLDR